MSDIKAQMEALDFSGKGKVLILKVPRDGGYTDDDIQNLLQTVGQISKDMGVKIPALILPSDIEATSLTKEEVKKILETLEK